MIKTEHELLSKHILSRVNLSEEELDFMLSQFTLTRVKKRQFIVQPNFPSKYQNFVVQGALRSYVVKEGGEDNTIQLAIEDWWITDYNSYYNQQPATLFIVALEDSLILQLDYEKEKMLKDMNHHYQTYFNIILEKCLAFMQKRIVSNLSKTAEERYLEAMEHYPHLALRVPQYAFASYIGMTTEYLSKLRNKRVSKS
jgi:CRP-like cAMP-binding protein